MKMSENQKFVVFFRGYEMGTFARNGLMENLICTHVVRCAIWHHLYNLKNAKNTHGGALILVNMF